MIAFVIIYNYYQYGYKVFLNLVMINFIYNKKILDIKVKESRIIFMIYFHRNLKPQYTDNWDKCSCSANYNNCNDSFKVCLLDI